MILADEWWPSTLTNLKQGRPVDWVIAIGRTGGSWVMPAVCWCGMSWWTFSSDCCHLIMWRCHRLVIWWVTCRSSLSRSHDRIIRASVEWYSVLSAGGIDGVLELYIQCWSLLLIALHWLRLLADELLRYNPWMAMINASSALHPALRRYMFLSGTTRYSFSRNVQ